MGIIKLYKFTERSNYILPFHFLSPPLSHWRAGTKFFKCWYKKKTSEKKTVLRRTCSIQTIYRLKRIAPNSRDPELTINLLVALVSDRTLGARKVFLELNLRLLLVKLVSYQSPDRLNYESAPLSRIVRGKSELPARVVSYQSSDRLNVLSLSLSAT